MYKYAVLNSDSLCIDIIEVLDINTLDGYQLPKGQCTLMYSENWENEAEVELQFNVNTNTFE